LDQQEKLAYEQGVEAGLAVASAILEELAEVMLERERTASIARKANYARRTRIKAYQVAARRIHTRLSRQQRLLAKLETREDQLRAEQSLRAAVENLAL
jgi:hypothetical protein